MRDVGGASRAPLRVVPIEHLEVSIRGKRTRLMLGQCETLLGQLRWEG